MDAITDGASPDVQDLPDIAADAQVVWIDKRSQTPVDTPPMLSLGWKDKSKKILIQWKSV